MKDTSSGLVADTRRKFFPVFAGAVLITLLAVGVGVQLLRAQNENRKSSSAITADIAQTSLLEQPAVRINGQDILLRELAQESLERYGRDVLENVINRTIIQQACAGKGVTVTDAEVNQEITKTSKRFGLPVDDWYRLLQAERGLTPLQYQRDVIWPLLALRKLAGREVRITREMMKESYVDNYGPRVKARMIVLDNRRRADEVWDKVYKHPEDFDDYARDYSTDSNSRALGGTIPPIRRYSGAHEAIRNTAFSMENGEISGLIQVDVRRFVILKCEGRTEKVPHDPKDVQSELHEELMEREVQKLVAETFDKLKKAARIDNYVTNESISPIRRVSASGEENNDSVFDISEPAEVSGDAGSER